MDTSLIGTGLGLVCHISLIVLGAALAGAVCAGVLRVATQIDDAVVGLCGKLAAVAVLFYTSGGYLQNQLISFAESVWASQAAYL